MFRSTSSPTPASARRPGTRGRATDARSGAGSQSDSYRVSSCSSSTASEPPRHSVTFSPVISRWTPPGHVPTSRWAAKKPSISRSTSSSRRVLCPEPVTKPFACIGSQTQTTGISASRTARSSGGSSSCTRLAPRRVISVSRPGERSGLSRSASATSSSGVIDGPTLAPTGLCSPERNSTWAPSTLPRALADPEEVARARVPVARRRVLAHERLLVVEQQRLVARPHVDLVDRALVAEVDPDRLHEAQRAADLVRDRLVAPPLERARDELLVPGVDLRQVGEAALRERAQEVERGDRLVVRLHEPLGVRRPRLERRLVGVHGVTAERRQLDAVDRSRSADERGFANCPASRPTLITGSVAP